MSVNHLLPLAHDERLQPQGGTNNINGSLGHRVRLLVSYGSRVSFYSTPHNHLCLLFLHDLDLFLLESVLKCGVLCLAAKMAYTLPFRDINVHASPSRYAFTSPSAPSAPTLVVDRPSGDLRMIDGTPTGAKRISSIAGILGIIKLRLGTALRDLTLAPALRC